MRIEEEAIAGIYDGERLLCRNCAEEEGVKPEDPEKLLLSEQIENTTDLFYCDKCKAQIVA